MTNDGWGQVLFIFGNALLLLGFYNVITQLFRKDPQNTKIIFMGSLCWILGVVCLLAFILT